MKALIQLLNLVLLLFMYSCNESVSPISFSNDKIKEQQILPISTFEMECLPENIFDLSIVLEGDTIKFWKIGYWHNCFLDLYLSQCTPPSECNTQKFIYIDSCINKFASTLVENYSDYINLTSSLNSWVQFSCNTEVLSLTDSLLTVIDNSIDTSSLWNSSEKALLHDIIYFGRNGFSNNSQKAGLIEDWMNIEGKLYYGSYSATMISILLFSDCYWQNYFNEQGSPRWLPIVATDLAGGWLSFTKEAMTGTDRNNPEAGMTYLKNAGMNALRCSAGPLGVLF